MLCLAQKSAHTLHAGGGGGVTAISRAIIGRCGAGAHDVRVSLQQHNHHHQLRTHMTDLDNAGDYADRETGHKTAWSSRDFTQRGFTVGIGGPVGSGKTALTLNLAEALRDTLPLGVVTNDIFTQEDAEFLVRAQALPRERIMAVETGGCPHAAIREDVTANLAALERLTRSIAAEQGGGEDNNDNAQQQQQQPLLICESGGDNLAANFSNELADFTLYVIDVAGGDKVPRKGGPGITQSDVLVINKTDLAEAVGADLGVMDRDAKIMRGDGPSGGPTVFTSVKNNVGVPKIIEHILHSFRNATGSAVMVVGSGHDHSHDHRSLE